jgi:hypothetical protein
MDQEYLQQGDPIMVSGPLNIPDRAKSAGWVMSFCFEREIHSFHTLFLSG